jgi:hypothetical protein
VLNLQKRPILAGYAEVLPWESGPRVSGRELGRFRRVGVAAFHVLSRARARSNPPSQFPVQDEEKGPLILRNAFKGYQDVKAERHGSQTTRGGGFWLDSHDCTGGVW